MFESTTDGGGDRTYNNYYCQNFQQVFTGVPVHIKHVITGVPKISYIFPIEQTESPALKRSNRISVVIWRSKYLKSDLICERFLMTHEEYLLLRPGGKGLNRKGKWVQMYVRECLRNVTPL